MMPRTPGLFRLAVRGLTFYRGSAIATTAGVTVAAAVLTGALLVGDSMKASLRENALARLGPIQHALIAPRFFRHEAAASLGHHAAGLILVPTVAVNPASQTRAGRVTAYGVDSNFWNLLGEAAPADGLGAVINENLATELNLYEGDDILLRLESRQVVPIESLLGRRDTPGTSLRLRVARIAPMLGAGNLDVRPQPGLPRNVFVPLPTLQRVLRQSGRVNAILSIADQSPDSAFQRGLILTDYGLRLALDEIRSELVLESDSFLIDPILEQIARQTARTLTYEVNSVLAYLVNSISVENTDRDATDTRPAVPYSTAAALDNFSGLTLTDSPVTPTLASDDVLLNEWIAEQLHAKVGDRIRLEYYVTRPFGGLDTVHSTLTLRGIVWMTGLGAEPRLTPRYEGITDTRRIGDWDPPFPMDMKRIEPADEAYWNQHKATPKVFVSTETGRRMWSESDPRFGQSTSLRLNPPSSLPLAEALARFEVALVEKIDPAAVGLAFNAVRQRAIEAAEGSTDFGMLFIGFSSFLILAAAMLVALLFRLGVERRASQVGLLLALGWPPRKTISLLLLEGLMICLAGTLIGLASAAGYAALMLTGLSTWWADAVRGPVLRLHLTNSTISVGGIVSLSIAMLSITWSVHGLKRRSVRALLAGITDESQMGLRPRSRFKRPLAVIFFILAILILGLSRFTDLIPSSNAFFLGGALVLAAALIAFSDWTASTSRCLAHTDRVATIIRLGARNIRRNPRRSLLTVGLIACACFVIVAVGANRHTVDPSDLQRTSGVGGFSLIGDSVAPILHDLNTQEGRAALNLSDDVVNALHDANVIAFRLRPGDDTSCLNLYQARTPRLLGATPQMIERGGFSFASSLADTPESRVNPWRLLEKQYDDGAIPCIGDANTVLWLLHLGLGKDFVMKDDRDRDLRLRIVAMLSGSVLQGELIIAERDFISRFPSVAGYNAFLIQSSPDRATLVEKTLERELSAYGLDLESTTRQLQAFLEIENTYLSAFATLGGMGLLLGTLGLTAVLIRSLLERRAELALLRALGWRNRLIDRMVFIENAALLAAGMSIGIVAALLAVAPQWLSHTGLPPWRDLSLTILLSMAVGLIALRIGLSVNLRGSLLASLRRE